MSLPDLIAEPKTAKQKLKNDVIGFLEEKDCKWRVSEVSSSGNGLVTALTDTLWAVDGHHHAFVGQRHKIPSTFSKFEGYNRPQVSKHRKRDISNMSGDTLRSMSSHLFHCLQGLYWQRRNWVELRNEVEQLANAVAKYADYLESSRKKSKLNHMVTSPVRELSDNLHFQFLPVCSSAAPASLQLIQSHLEELPDYETACIEELQMCPSDSRSKYSLTQTLKAVGLPFPSALLTYSHGNNVGNLNFFVEGESSRRVVLH